MKMILNNLLQCFTRGFCKLSKRCLHASHPPHRPRAYEGEGKTTANILNNEKELGLMINGYSQVGFRLNNDITVLGSMVIFPRSVLSWTVQNISEVNEDSFSLFTVLEPRLDLIVLGIGDRTKDLTFYKKIVPIAKKHKFNFEILPTEVACATFNFLCSEGRHVAGAMIPPESVEATLDDELKTKIRYQNLYEKE